MREIKFRAWHTAHKKMYAHGNLDVGLKNVKDCTLWKFMQFTGLKDKNGKEIYEGDIVRHETDFNVDVHGTYVDYEIVYRNGCWMSSYWASQTGQRLPKGYTCGLICEVFYDDISKEFYFADDDYYNKIDTLEIIGNIHENPELLKENEA